jgi:hypothetical protein
MQVNFQPLQILSRLMAVFVVALPLAGLQLALDDYERQAIPKMTHQELVAFVEEVHAASYLGAYFRTAIVMLILVAAVEAVAFVIRLIVVFFSAGKPPFARQDEFVSARVNAYP